MLPTSASPAPKPVRRAGSWASLFLGAIAWVLPASLWASASVSQAAAPDTASLPSSGIATYGYAPTTTQAGTDFTFKLTPNLFDCNTLFQVVGAEVNDTTITFAFIHSERAKPLNCAVVDMVPPTLTFKVPALKAGTYSLYALAYPECAYATDPSQPVCKIAVKPEFFGSLTAKTGSVAPDSAWHVRPTSVESGKPFDLAVVNQRYGNCQTSFYGQSAQVQSETRTIHLSFAVESHPERVCIQDVRPHGPTFSMPALKAGAYQVMVSVLPACAVPREPNGPICLIGIIPQAAAESLVVKGDSPAIPSGWFAQPQAVKPHVDFTLQVLNYAYHPCAFSFTHPSLVVDGKKLMARFAVEVNAAAICPADLRPGGPSFNVKGLPPGDYEVLVSTPPACLFLPQPCEIAELAPAVSDTLQIMPVTSALRRGAEGRPANRVNPALVRGQAAEGRDLAGRALREARHEAGARAPRPVEVLPAGR